MALAPFFGRVYGALGGHLQVSKESLASALGSVVVGIECLESDSDNAVWSAELCVNLVARLYPRIAIATFPDLSPRLADLARSINPDIELVSDAPLRTTMRIGSQPTGAEIGISSGGWVACVGSPLACQGPANPYAAGAAAALGCGALFRRIFLGTESEPGVTISLLSYDGRTGGEDELGPHDIGDVWFAGVGAVGNAALWAIARDRNVSGHLTLIDPEALSSANLQRYVLGTSHSVGAPKVQIARSALTDTRLLIDSAESTLEAFVDARNGVTSQTIVVSVDNIDGRRSAQALLPRLVINGWTGEQALGASWHEFDHEAACLACLYHPHGQGVSAVDQAARALGLPLDRAALLWVTKQPLALEDLRAAAQSLGVDLSMLAPWLGRSLGELYTDAVCGALPLDVTGVGRLEIVPLAHQSALAGILMAAELIKRTSRDLSARSQREALVSYDNVLGGFPAIWAKPRAREPGCICGDDDYQTAYRTKWR